MQQNQPASLDWTSIKWLTVWSGNHLHCLASLQGFVSPNLCDYFVEYIFNHTVAERNDDQKNTLKWRRCRVSSFCPKWLTAHELVEVGHWCIIVDYEALSAGMVASGILDKLFQSHWPTKFSSFSYSSTLASIQTVASSVPWLMG